MITYYIRDDDDIYEVQKPGTVKKVVGFSQPVENPVEQDLSELREIFDSDSYRIQFFSTENELSTDQLINGIINEGLPGDYEGKIEGKKLYYTPEDVKNFKKEIGYVRQVKNPQDAGFGRRRRRSGKRVKSRRQRSKKRSGSRRRSKKRSRRRTNKRSQRVTNKRSRRRRSKKRSRRRRRDRVELEIITISADSWCGYCVKMAEQKDQVQKLAEKQGATYTFVSDTESKVQFESLREEHNVTGFPHSIIKKNGKVVGENSGYLPAEQFVSTMIDKA